MLTNREKLSKPPEILLPCVCPSVYADKKIKKNYNSQFISPDVLKFSFLLSM